MNLIVPSCDAKSRPVGKPLSSTVVSQLLLKKPPEDAFYPVNLYQDKVAKLPMAKKLGHKVTTINGHRGVVVPNATSEAWDYGAWKLRRVFGQDLSLQEEHDVGASDEEADPQSAEDKFEDLASERDTAYKAAAAGMVFSVFAKFAADVATNSSDAKQDVVAPPKNEGVF